MPFEPLPNPEFRAVAELARARLRLGQFSVAACLYEGLCLLEPREPHFWVALGVAREALNDAKAARLAYQQAARLPQGDGRAELLWAELSLEEGSQPGALRLLQRAAERARRAGATALASRAEALTELLRRPR